MIDFKIRNIPITLYMKILYRNNIDVIILAVRCDAVLPNVNKSYTMCFDFSYRTAYDLFVEICMILPCCFNKQWTHTPIIFIWFAVTWRDVQRSFTFELLTIEPSKFQLNDMGLIFYCTNAFTVNRVTRLSIFLAIWRYS